MNVIVVNEDGESIYERPFDYTNPTSAVHGKYNSVVNVDILYNEENITSFTLDSGERQHTVEVPHPGQYMAVAHIRVDRFENLGCHPNEDTFPADVLTECPEIWYNGPYSDEGGRYTCDWAPANCSDSFIPHQQYWKHYTFISATYVMTHMESGENDNVKIYLETRPEVLGQIDSNISYILSNNATYDEKYNFSWEGKAARALVEKKIKDMITPHSLQNTLKGTVGANLIVNTASEFGDEAYDYLTKGDTDITPDYENILLNTGASAVVLGTAYFVSVPPSTMAAPAIILSVMYQHSKDYAEFCEGTSSDDYQIILARSPNFCFNESETYYNLTVINRGFPLWDAEISTDLTIDEYFGFVDSSEVVTRKTPYRIPMDSCILNTRNIWNEGFAIEYDNYMLWEKKCNQFDPIYSHTDQRIREKPYIFNITYPASAEIGENIFVTTQIIDDSGVGSVTLTIQDSVQPYNYMTRINGSEFDGTWTAYIQIPTDNPPDSFLKFSITAWDESSETVNDNDGLMHKIYITEAPTPTTTTNPTTTTQSATTTIPTITTTVPVGEPDVVVSTHFVNGVEDGESYCGDSKLSVILKNEGTRDIQAPLYLKLTTDTSGVTVTHSKSYYPKSLRVGKYTSEINDFEYNVQGTTEQEILSTLEVKYFLERGGLPTYDYNYIRVPVYCEPPPTTTTITSTTIFNPPTTPIFVESSALCSGEITLDWSDSFSEIGVSGYKVSELTCGAETETYQATESNLELQDKGVAEYTFRVRAIDNNGVTSEWSEPSTATVNQCNNLELEIMRALGVPGEVIVATLTSPGNFPIPDHPIQFEVTNGIIVPLETQTTDDSSVRDDLLSQGYLCGEKTVRWGGGCETIPCGPTRCSQPEPQSTIIWHCGRLCGNCEPSSTVLTDEWGLATIGVMYTGPAPLVTSSDGEGANDEIQIVPNRVCDGVHPPSLGDWLISETTSCQTENITLSSGNLELTGGYVLTLNDSTLSLNGEMILDGILELIKSLIGFE